jgi:pSer/pThr/pTyr-binding forkhead associated (FHA) protein
MTQLVIILDKQIIKRFNVKGTSVTLGRHPKSDIALPDRTISTHHARISIVREDCFLEDLDSTNGTYVNQQRIDKHFLDDGDVIGLGKYQVVFHSLQGVESQVRRLSVHPKLVERGHPAWLSVVSGRKTGHIIPLHHTSIVLGNDDTGKILIEYTPQGDYIAKITNAAKVHTERKLLPGDELEIADISFQFCVKTPNAITPKETG